jgi:hypothetical protein
MEGDKSFRFAFVTGWLAYKKYRQPAGESGVFDPTEIHSRYSIVKQMFHKFCNFNLPVYRYLFFSWKILYRRNSFQVCFSKTKASYILYFQTVRISIFSW